MYYTGSNAFATLRQGLVGAWCPSLPNGGSGNTLPDVSGYGNHGSLVNMSPDDWVSGQYGRALDFDGVNDYVSAGNFFVDKTVTVLTCSLWYRVRSSYGITINANWTTGFVWYIDPTGPRQVLYIGQASSSSSTIPSDGTTWRQYWFSFNNGTTRAGHDGRQITETAYGTSPNFTTNGANGGKAVLQFGGYGSSETLNGNIDDIRIYNRALTESEIRLLASRPGIGLRQDRDRNTFYQFPSGARRKRILTGMP